MKDSNPKDETDTRRGWGPTRRDWYSICSRHQRFNSKCDLCAKGGWVNHWRHRVGGAVFAVSPGLWRLWANLPWKKRAFAQKMRDWGFPNFGRKP